MSKFVPFKAPEWWIKSGKKEAEKEIEVKEKVPEENKKVEKKESK